MAETKGDDSFDVFVARVSNFLCAYTDLHGECRQLLQEAQSIIRIMRVQSSSMLATRRAFDDKADSQQLIEKALLPANTDVHRATPPLTAIPKPLSLRQPLDQLEHQALADVEWDAPPLPPEGIGSSPRISSSFSVAATGATSAENFEEAPAARIRKTARISEMSCDDIDQTCFESETPTGFKYARFSLARSNSKLPRLSFDSMLSSSKKGAKSHTFKRMLSQTLKSDRISTRSFRPSVKTKRKLIEEKFSDVFPSSEDVVTRMVEPVMGAFIILHCILTGLSLDTEEWDGWRVIDWFFAVVYTVEMIIKISLLGFRHMYCGSSGAWSVFDTMILLLAILDVILQFGGAVSVFRLLRFARLVRLFRLLRLPIMNELMLLIRGMVGGARCLFSCLFFLSLVDFIVGMVLSQVLRDWGDDKLFGSVPMAMFTTFRCMVGDCTDGKGRPIFMLIAKKKGGQFAFGYAIFILVIFFGVFNLITAIFIESTMQAAKSDTAMLRQFRHAENKRFTRNIKTLLYKIWLENGRLQAMKAGSGQRHAFRTSQESLANFQLADAMDMSFDEESYQEIVNNPEVREVFDDLGLDEDDIADLFGTLDADDNGSLDMIELVNGLHRLRGDPSKKDLVGLSYVMYSVQDSIQALTSRVDSLCKKQGLQASATLTF